MNYRRFFPTIPLLFLCFVGCGHEARTAPPETAKQAEAGDSGETKTGEAVMGVVEQEVDRILADMQKFLDTEKPKSLDAFKPLFDRFEKLYSDNLKARPDDAVMALMTAGNVYGRFFGRPDLALSYFERIAKDFAGTPTGRNAEENVTAVKDLIARQAEREKLMIAQQEAMFAEVRARQEAAGIVVGKPMPDFKRLDSTGHEISLNALKGKPALLVFWASWCGPCMQEAPNIKSVYEEFKAKGFQVLGINKDDSPVAMERAVDRVGLPWPQHQDLDDSLSLQFGAASLPTIYLIDANGNLAASGLEVRGPNLRNSVAKLFAE